MAEPPSLDAGEATDKGSINQRAVLARRAALVEELYAKPGLAAHHRDRVEFAQQVNGLMKRRDFIISGGAAVAWPLAARAQQPAMPVVGVMVAGSREPLRQQLAAFEDGLKASGYVAGQNVAVEHRFAEGQFERFPAFASELVRRPVNVLVTSSNTGALAAKRATATIPIVFSVGDDPVRTGIVTSLNRPGGNMTGVYQFTTGLEAKRLGLLHEMVPKAGTIAVLIHSNFAAAETQVRDVQEAAPRLGVQLFFVRVSSESEFDTAFAAVARQRAGGASGLRVAVLLHQAPAACRAGGTPWRADNL